MRLSHENVMNWNARKNLLIESIKQREETASDVYLESLSYLNSQRLMI